MGFQEVEPLGLSMVSVAAFHWEIFDKRETLLDTIFRSKGAVYEFYTGNLAQLARD
jgi:hypothetical protein